MNIEKKKKKGISTAMRSQNRVYARVSYMCESWNKSVCNSPLDKGSPGQRGSHSLHTVQMNSIIFQLEMRSRGLKQVYVCPG